MTEDLTARFFGAAYNGDLPKMRTLIANGADVLAKDTQGRTADAVAGMAAFHAAKERIAELESRLAEAKDELMAATLGRKPILATVKAWQSDARAEQDDGGLEWLN